MSPHDGGPHRRAAFEASKLCRSRRDMDSDPELRDAFSDTEHRDGLVLAKKTDLSDGSDINQGHDTTSQQGGIVSHWSPGISQIRLQPFSAAEQ